MIWRPVTGFKRPHRVSDMGVLQCLKSDGSWHDVPVHLRPSRVEVYPQTPDGRSPTRILARIVYEAFRGPIPATHNVIHKNGLKADCSIYNLEAINRKKPPSRPGNSRPVMKVDRDGNVVDIYASCSEAARKNHISQSAMSNRCAGLIQDPYRLDGYNYVYEQHKRGGR